jgi:hypothetical protein
MRGTTGGGWERRGHGAAGAPGPLGRQEEPGRWTALTWLLRRFPAPEATERGSPAEDRAVVAAQVAALRARIPERAAPVEAVLAALNSSARF